MYIFDLFKVPNEQVFIELIIPPTRSVLVGTLAGRAGDFNVMSDMEHTKLELLEGLDGMISDYGGGGIEFPDHIEEKDFSLLAEDEINDLLDHNMADEDAIREYLEGAQ